MVSVASDPATIAHLTERVVEVANQYVVITGEVLQLGLEAFGREGYEQWIAEWLPFNVSTAERYRAVHLAITHLPEAPLPAAHGAMYAVGHGAMPEQHEQPGRTADELAADLLRYFPRELSPRLRVALEVWLVGDH